MAVACRYLSPACLASSSHLVPATRAALAVTDTCMVRRRVQYGTGSVCGNRARNVGIVRKSCRGEQRARPTLAPRLAQAQHASLAVPTGLASAAPRADAQRRGRRMTGARANQTPPDFVVKFQRLDIVDVTFRWVLRPHVVYQREITG